ncbi:hypothetical protein [Nocardia sp. XZ_19_385]|uniref:hypothetical protein n=1 Tax=Nocardia sp. XZ_19_385 TaxID=2769488 RepID=UPI00188F9A19|nr:hypothetical protein [Nocardia sp. XZ_19_385]
MTIEHPIEDEVTQLARRVEKARGRLAWQFDPALTEALSEDELHAERELAERIREQDRGQRWKEVQALAGAADRARQTTEAIEKADMRDLLVARKAIAAQRRESSPHARLASLYRHRAWSLRALAGVVGAGMLWSAVNVQHNIAPGGPSDPLFWFSYLLEGMISVCLIIIMIGTNKVSEWGVVDNRGQVALAELALLGLTVCLNTYPYLRVGEWYEVAVHAIAPVMIGVALLIHDAASARYGLAIARATEQVKEMPDPVERIRRQLPSLAGYTRSATAKVAAAKEAEPVVEPEPVDEVVAEPVAEAAVEVTEMLPPPLPPAARNGKRNGAPVPNGVHVATAPRPAPEKRRAPVDSGKVAAVLNTDQPVQAKMNGRPAPAASAEKRVAPVVVENRPKVAENRPTVVETRPVVVETRPAAETRPVVAESRPAVVEARPVVAEPRPATRVSTQKPVAAVQVASEPAPPAKARKVEAPVPQPEVTVVAERKPSSKPTPAEKASAPEPDPLYDTGQFRVADILEQELAELQAERRKARTSKQRTATR